MVSAKVSGYRVYWELTSPILTNSWQNLIADELINRLNWISKIYVFPDKYKNIILIEKLRDSDFAHVLRMRPKWKDNLTF